MVTDTCIISGTDRLYHVEDISRLSAGRIALETPINAQSLPRLEKVSDAFQRIKFKKLQFRVTPQISTATSGGYVVAFCADVTDRFWSNEKGLSKLTSQKGSKTQKWWEGATVIGQCTNDLLYTSTSLEEPRLSSPGKFVLAVDGRASQEGSLTVHLDWCVELSVPSLEGNGNDEKSIPELQYSLWTKAGDDGLWALIKDNDYNSLDQDARHAITGTVKTSSYYRLNGVRTFLVNTANAISGMVGFNYVYVGADYKMYAADPEDKTARSKQTAYSYGHTMVAAKGEFLESEASQDDYHFLKGSRFLCHLPPWLPSVKIYEEVSNLFPSSSLNVPNEETQYSPRLRRTSEEFSDLGI